MVSCSLPLAPVPLWSQPGTSAMLESIAIEVSLASDMGDQRNGEDGRRRLPAQVLRQQRRVEDFTARRATKPTYPWTTTLMVFGLFLALYSFFSVSWWTLVQPVTLLRVLFVLCFTGPAIGLIQPRVRMGMEHLEWLFFNMLAVGPWTLCLFLWINYAFHGPVSFSDHPIGHVRNTTTRHNRTGETVTRSSATVHFELADGYLAEYPWALSTWREFVHGYSDSLRVGVAEGCFGVEVVIEKEQR